MLALFTRNHRLTLLMLFSIAVLAVAACSGKRVGAAYSDLRTQKVDGTEEVWSSFFIDQYEVSNGHWLVYRNWLKMHYGKHSPEYLESALDTKVWMKNELYDEVAAVSYHLNPAFEDDPIVGVSQAQATRFCEWRSDRVLESFLKKSGEFNKLDADLKLRFSTFGFIDWLANRSDQQATDLQVPTFRLPSVSESIRVRERCDSVNHDFFNDFKVIKPNCCENGFPNWNAEKSPRQKRLLGWVTRPVFEDCVSPKSPQLYNLRGNVSEWTNEYQVAVGGGWLHNREQLLNKDRFYHKEPNAWTGFRCVLEWKSPRDLMLAYDE